MATDELDAKFAEWLAARPRVIQDMAREHPPNRCYRSKVNSGHYIIHAYSEGGTMTLIHGHDSFLPGVATFGQDPNQLVDCGCGNWEWPTEDQAEKVRAFIERQARKRGKANPC